jgi:hypothetical protein
MTQGIFRKVLCGTIFAALCLINFAYAQTSSAPVPQPAQTPPGPTHADILRGEYGEFRANNDLLSYHLDVRVDPEKKYLSGKNSVRFKMLKDGTRIQLDLHSALNVDKILLGTTPLKYEHHRFLLLRKSSGDRALRRHHF